MLEELHLRHVGPAPEFRLELGERLNLLTGDNGLGKSFLLDVAWWALTGTWAGSSAWPRRDGPQATPEICCRFADGRDPGAESLRSSFDFQRQAWTRRWPVRRIQAVVIYARVDGGFSVWDPARSHLGDEGGLSVPTAVPTSIAPSRAPTAYHFTSSTLWNGLEQDGKVVCNGLIRDWVSWQNQPDQDERSPFRALSRVIARLSPHPTEWMRPGKPTRVSIADVRDIPTIELPYGSVPVIYASAGVQRILALAYLLVWTWYEHVQASRLANTAPAQSLVLLMDEVEAHLHPRWQRTIMPALLGAAGDLQKSIRTQVIATTHSPLLLASVEPLFDESRDCLFSFQLEGGRVSLDQVPWAKQGDAVGWLTSDIFGLRQARSQEAEVAIEAAEAFMRGDDMRAYPEHLRTQQQIHKELLRVLAGHDPFWPRWIVAVESEHP